MHSRLFTPARRIVQASEKPLKSTQKNFVFFPVYLDVIINFHHKIRLLEGINITRVWPDLSLSLFYDTFGKEIACEMFERSKKRRNTKKNAKQITQLNKGRGRGRHGDVNRMEE